MASTVSVTEYAGPAMLVAGAKVVGGAAMVAMNLWLAGHLPPSAFGVFATATAALLLCDAVFGSAVDAAVIRTTEGTPSRRMTDHEYAAIALKVGVLACVAASALPAAGLFAPVGTVLIALLVALGGSGLLVHRSVLLYLQLRTRFVSYALVDVLHTAARWLFALAALAVGYQSAAMMVGAWALAPWIVVAIACAAFGRSALGGDPGGRAAAARGSSPLEAVMSATGWTVATTGVGAIVARLDLLLLGAVAGAREAGIFAAAATLALAPTLLGAYLAPAFSGRILPYCREGRMNAFLRRMQGTLIALALAGAAVCIAALPAMTEALPQDYRESARVFPVLLVAGAAGFVTFPIVLHTLLLLSPRTYLLMDLFSLPILVPMYVVAARRSGAVGVAWVTAGAAVVKAGVAQAVALGATRREQARVDSWARVDEPVRIPG